MLSEAKHLWISLIDIGPKLIEILRFAQNDGQNNSHGSRTGNQNDQARKDLWQGIDSSAAAHRPPAIIAVGLLRRSLAQRGVEAGELLVADRTNARTRKRGIPGVEVLHERCTRNVIEACSANSCDATKEFWQGLVYGRSNGRPRECLGTPQKVSMYIRPAFQRAALRRIGCAACLSMNRNNIHCVATMTSNGMSCSFCRGGLK